MLATLLISADSTPPSTRTFAHVRVEDARVRALLGGGYSSSPTLARLIDTVERLPCIVYVVPAARLPRGQVGALLHTSAGRPELPILRVLIKANRGREETLATIAHELQHVTEAMAAPPAPGGIDFSAAFDRLDPMTARRTGIRTYETEAAMAVTARVHDELRKSRR